MLELLGFLVIFVRLDSVAVLVKSEFVSVFVNAVVLVLWMVIGLLHTLVQALVKALALKIIVVVIMILVLELNVTRRTVTHRTREVLVVRLLFLYALSSRGLCWSNSGSVSDCKYFPNIVDAVVEAFVNLVDVFLV